MISEDDALLTFEEAVDYLNVSSAKMYRIIRSEELAAYKVNNKWRFYRKDLDAYKVKEAEKSEEKHARIRKYNREYRQKREKQDPIYREKRREQARERNIKRKLKQLEDPVYQEKQREKERKQKLLEDPTYQEEKRAKRRERAREYRRKKLQDPINREKENERMRNYYHKRYSEDPDFRAKILQGNREYLQRIALGDPTASNKREYRQLPPVSQEEREIARYKKHAEDLSLPAQVRARYRKLVEDPTYREQEREYNYKHQKRDKR